MKPTRIISVGALALMLGVVAPMYAQQDQGAKPDTHQQAKPEKQKPARPAKQEHRPAKTQQRPEQQPQRTRTSTQHEQRPARTQPTHTQTRQHQQPASHQQHGLPPGHQWARSGQRDSHGHVYSPSRFGPDHHARFVRGGGRFYGGHREYSYGGYWFYADSYPAWFYQQDVYFIMGADGLWYAVSYNDPSLMIQVYIQ